MNRQKQAKDTKDTSLGRRFARAAAWMVAFRWIDRVIGLLSVALLARILAPEDFGIVGYGMLIIGFLDLFTGLSTDAELIRHQDPDRAYYNAAWTMNVLRGFAIGVLILILTQPAAAFFHEPRLEGVMFALAAVPIIQGFENIGVVEFRKRLEFDREFRFLLVSRIVGTVAAVALALVLRNYWALVAGSALRVAFRVALSYGFHPFRPRVAWLRVAEIFRFSRWIMLQNLASGVNEKLPAMVIGRELNSVALAFFNMSKEIADLSVTEIRAPIRRALYPSLTQIAHQPERLRNVLVQTTGMLALLTIPIPLGIALVAEDLVPLFLGSQWQPTVLLLQPLCLAVTVSALGTNSQLAYVALNRAYLTAVAAFARVLLLLALLLSVPSSYGAVGVAYAVAAASFIMLIADYALASRILRIRAGSLLRAAWRPVTASLVMCVAVWLMRSGFAPAADISGHLLSLTRSALVGVVIYVVCELALWMAAGRPGGAEGRVVALLTNYADRLRRKAG